MLNALSLCLYKTGHETELETLYAADPGELTPTLSTRHPELPACLEDPATTAQLDAEWALLQQWGIRVTPSFYEMP